MGKLLLTFPDQATEEDFERFRTPRVLPISQVLVSVYFLFGVLFMARHFTVDYLDWGTPLFPSWYKYWYFIPLTLGLLTGCPLIWFKEAAVKNWTAIQFLLCMTVLSDSAARFLLGQSVRLQHASHMEGYLVLAFFYIPLSRAFLFRGSVAINVLILGMFTAVMPFRKFSCSAGVMYDVPLYGTVFTISLVFAWLLERMERQEYVVRMQLDEEIQVRKAAEKAALDARDAQGMFLARMSHEIRTPLNGILGLMDLVLEMGHAEGPLDLLFRMKKAGNHLMSIVNDVLDLAKITAGKLELKSTAMPMHEMPSICFDLFASKLTEKHLRHRVEVAHDVPQVLYGDRTRLMQIFTNLVSNAVKFTPQGGLISISVQLALRQPHSGQHVVANDVCSSDRSPHFIDYQNPDQNQVHVLDLDHDPHDPSTITALHTIPSPIPSLDRIHPPFEGPSVVLECTICDTGKGMTVAQQNKLFTPYYQCESGIDREHEGTGLGLSIVQRLVELMGGTLSVSSDSGKGTSFTFTIPLQVSRETSAAADDSNRSPPQQMDWRGKTCLLTDDTPLNILVLQRQLEKRGCVVLTATNGRESVDVWKVERSNLDLIFMDVWMPVLNGLEATKELRSLGASLPIIGLTADFTSAIAQQGLQAGMTSVLLKPLAWDQLERIVAENLPPCRETLLPAGASGDSL